MVTVATFARRSPLTVGIKSFHVQRQLDNAHPSIVGKGAILPSGQCVLQWLNQLNQVAAVAMFKSLDEMTAIHGHSGQTVVLLR